MDKGEIHKLTRKYGVNKGVSKIRAICAKYGIFANISYGYKGICDSCGHCKPLKYKEIDKRQGNTEFNQCAACRYKEPGSLSLADVEQDEDWYKQFIKDL